VNWASSSRVSRIAPGTEALARAGATGSGSAGAGASGSNGWATSTGSADTGASGAAGAWKGSPGARNELAEASSSSTADTYGRGWLGEDGASSGAGSAADAPSTAPASPGSARWLGSGSASAVHGRANASHEDDSTGGLEARSRLGSGGASDGGAITTLGSPAGSGLGGSGSAAAAGRYWSSERAWSLSAPKSPARYVRASTGATGTSPSGAATVLTVARPVTGTNNGASGDSEEEATRSNGGPCSTADPYAESGRNAAGSYGGAGSNARAGS